jgi:hypothetical protein
VRRLNTSVERAVVENGTARDLARALTLLRRTQETTDADLTTLRTMLAALPIEDDEAVRMAMAGPRVVDCGHREIPGLARPHRDRRPLTDDWREPSH